MKKQEVQTALQKLTEDDIKLGSISITNAASNPDNAPQTGEELLKYINAQNVSTYTKAPVEAYGRLWELLDDSATSEFLDKFKNLFKKVVRPFRTAIYLYPLEEDDDTN